MISDVFFEAVEDIRAHLDTSPSLDNHDKLVPDQLLTQTEAAQYIGIPLHALVRLNIARKADDRRVRYRKSVLDALVPLASLLRSNEQAQAVDVRRAA